MPGPRAARPTSTSPAPAAETRSTTRAASTSSATGSGGYTVKSGDTLSTIASALGTSWESLYNLNRSIISDPNWIQIGQQLKTGGSSSTSTTAHSTTRTTHAAASTAAASGSGKTYTVRSGDSLYKIASNQHVSGGWSGLYNLNKGAVADPNVIQVGQVLTLG